MSELPEADEPATAPAELPEFNVAVPANWYALDLDPRTRTEAIAKVVEQRLGPGTAPEQLQVRRELTGMLRGYARQAASHGAIYAALMDEVLAGTPISASMIVAAGEAPRDDDGEPILAAEDLAAALAASEQDPGFVSADVGDKPAPEVFEMLAGMGVRLRRTTEAGIVTPDGRELATAESQYFVAVPDTDKVLVLTFSTPNLGVREALEELFDAIARTLDWVYDGPAPAAAEEDDA